MLDTIVGFFQEGGVFMYPIALVLTLGLAIAIERYVYLSKEKLVNRSAFDKGLLPMIEKRRFSEAAEFASDSKAPIATMLSVGLNRFLDRRARDEVEYAMEEALMEVLPRLERRTPYLAMLANIATLLGLLGTIIGLIAAFTAVASADPAQKASLLSQSISVAMNTTAFGLMAAIPLLLFHSVLQAKTNEIIDSFEMAGIKFLNLCASADVR
jgi:biopolymer transport protein ExbB